VALKPVSVSVDAKGLRYAHYKSGVFDHENLVIILDHATLVVGYGATASGEEFWIMKNSWNEDWGEKGYMRVKIVDGAGITGIQKEPLYADTN